MCDTDTLLLQNDRFNVNAKLIFLSRRLWLVFAGIDGIQYSCSDLVSCDMILGVYRPMKRQNQK